MKRIRAVAVCVLFISTIPTLQSCSKKDSGGGDNGNDANPAYYLTATLDGKSWAANVKAPALDNSPSIAALTKVNGANIMLLIGISAKNKDTTAFALVFPQSIQLNKATAFDATKSLEGAYISETMPGSGSYYGYNTTPAIGGSGTITVTSFDQVSKIIEGTFTGTFGSQNNKAAIKVTDGKFRCIYTADTNPLLSSGLKF